MDLFFTKRIWQNLLGRTAPRARTNRLKAQQSTDGPHHTTRQRYGLIGANLANASLSHTSARHPAIPLNTHSASLRESTRLAICIVQVRVAPSSQFKVGPLGLRQGREFEERSSGVLKELHGWYSSAGVHQISTVYSDGATYRHGLETPGCHCSVIYLLPGEALTYVHGSVGQVVLSLAFHTSLQRSYGPFGKPLGCPFGFCGPVLNFVGRCDHMIRAIGAYCTFR